MLKQNFFFFTLFDRNYRLTINRKHIATDMHDFQAINTMPDWLNRILRSFLQAWWDLCCSLLYHSSCYVSDNMGIGSESCWWHFLRFSLLIHTLWIKISFFLKIILKMYFLICYSAYNYLWSVKVNLLLSIKLNPLGLN